MSALSASVELRDPYTAGHQERVARIASAVASELHLESRDIEEIELAARILAAFAQLTFIAAVCGGVLLAVLIRRSSAPRQRFVRITAGLTALSCVAPAAFADTTASKIALVGLHILAATIIVPVLARRAN